MKRVSKMHLILALSFPVFAPAASPAMSDWKGLAQQIVGQLQLEPGETVLVIARPGLSTEIIPYLRYGVLEHGGIDLGTLQVPERPHPAAVATDTLRKGFPAVHDRYVDMLQGVDVAVMLPGTSPADAAYKAFQTLLANERGARRAIHFHWTDPYNALGNVSGLIGISLVPGSPPPDIERVNRVYQRAVIDTDYSAMREHQRRFATAMRGALIRVTNSAGTDLEFRIGDRPIVIQDGDASAARMRRAITILDREVELPAGAVRVAPLEDTVQGVIAYAESHWNGHVVRDVMLTFRGGRIAKISAAQGREHVEAELRAVPQNKRALREFVLGFNRALAIDPSAPWVGYFGYGAGVVRLGLGNNTELNGATGGSYVRWRDLMTDATVTIDGETWVRAGELVR